MNGAIIASLTQNIATATPELVNATTEIVKTTTTNVPYILIAAVLCITIGAATCAIAQGKVIEKIADGIARQPEAANDLRGSMIIGLAMIESLAIYCLLISILLIFMKS